MRVKAGGGGLPIENGSLVKPSKSISLMEDVW